MVTNYIMICSKKLTRGWSSIIILLIIAVFDIISTTHCLTKLGSDRIISIKLYSGLVSLVRYKDNFFNN